MSEEQKNKLISGAITAAIMAILVVICVSFGYNPPNPPIPEEGVEVNLGDSDFGFGNSPDLEPSSASSQYVPPAANERVSTQTTETTTPLNSSTNNGTITNPNAQVQPREENKEPDINRDALFTGRRNKTSNGGNEGQSTGEGNQGKANGDPNSQRYDGQPGSGGPGVSLAGRKAVSLPAPKYNSNKQGKIIVKIWVDRSGTVTRVEAPEKGSNILDDNMVRQAKETALKTKFSAKPDAPETQTGTITYHYNIVN
ncbi:MAG: energy transducer TonB [Bacteroidales bacterium]|nr:energy transducer TonB [Bacteroidales bacterium]